MAEPHRTEIRDALLAASLTLTARQGAEGFSLRAIAAAAGRSTTVIFQQFGSKEGLLRATLAHALTLCEKRQEAVLAALDDMPRNPATLRDAIAFHILDEVRRPATRLFLEALFKRDHFPEIAELLRDWDAMRRRFWAALLAGSRYASLAPIFASYAVIEQGFAAALEGEPRYALLLRETLAGLLYAGATDLKAEQGVGTAIAWAEQRAFPKEERPPSTPAMEALLDLAARAVIEHGPAAINPRRLATQAGVPPSLIVYHYGDFAAFTRAAVWRAIMHGLPRYLDLGRQEVSGRDAEDWLQELARSLHPSGTETPAGFYVHYARMLGQLGTLSQRHPEFVPLLLQLRAIEGMGIERASRSLWPERYRLDRTSASGFAIWMKGRAILNERLALDDAPGAHERDILRALSALIGA